MDNEKTFTISENKKILNEYEKFRVKELPKTFLCNKTEKILFKRTNSKMIYKCLVDGRHSHYEVFINFLESVSLRFWVCSIYDYVEIYPDKNEFDYRAWIYVDIKDALKKYESLD